MDQKSYISKSKVLYFKIKSLIFVYGFLAFFRVVCCCVFYQFFLCFFPHNGFSMFLFTHQAQAITSYANIAAMAVPFLCDCCGCQVAWGLQIMVAPNIMTS